MARHTAYNRYHTLRGAGLGGWGGLRGGDADLWRRCGVRGGRPASSDGPAPPQGASQGPIANRRQRVAPPANVGHWSPISRNRSQDAASPSLIYRTSSLYLSAPPPHLGAHELPLSATPKTHPLRPSPHSPSPSSRPPNRRDPFTLSFLCPLNNRASGSYSVHSGLNGVS